MFKRKEEYATERQLNHMITLVSKQIRDALTSTANRYDVKALETQIKVLQDIIVKAGLVEDYESPAEKGKTIYRLGDGLYTVKKGK
jgi:hypothetical protein